MSFVYKCSINRFTHPNPVYGVIHTRENTLKLCRQQAEVIHNHENANVRNIGQIEAQHRKYKRLKLGGCQAYDRSSAWVAVVT
jgi:hypothetical protein